jgi:hypothetical protein
MFVTAESFSKRRVQQKPAQYCLFSLLGVTSGGRGLTGGLETSHTPQVATITVGSEFDKKGGTFNDLGSAGEKGDCSKHHFSITSHCGLSQDLVASWQHICFRNSHFAAGKHVAQKFSRVQPPRYSCLLAKFWRFNEH